MSPTIRENLNYCTSILGVSDYVLATMLNITQEKLELKSSEEMLSRLKSVLIKLGGSGVSMKLLYVALNEPIPSRQGLPLIYFINDAPEELSGHLIGEVVGLVGEEEEVTITRRQADEALRNYLTTSGNENDTYFSYMSTLGFNPGETKR